MPGRFLDSRVQPSCQTEDYPLSVITMANPPAALIPRRVAEKITSQYLYRSGEAYSPILLSAAEEEDFLRFRYHCRLPLYLPGDTVSRANNIVKVGSAILRLGDVPFALFVRLAAELFKNKGSMVRKSRLINAGYIKADGEFQAIGRLRQLFRPVLQNVDPQDFIESCQPRYIRLSTHPAFISYDKPRLLAHRNLRVRRLARQLP